MPKIRIALLITMFFGFQAYACDENIECPKCGEKSEYTWNPSNQHTTSRLNRFYEMESLISIAYESGDYEKASNLIKEDLELAQIYRCNWNYGNSIHNSNSVLGFIALSNDDIDGASKYLVAAGKSTGSPQLDSFGPNLDLANELLSLGQKEAVVEYLKGVRKFWNGKESTIDEWIGKIEAGEEIELNQYTPGAYEIIAYAVSIAWPFLLVIGFWFRLEGKIPNKWLFPVISIPAGFIAMTIGGIILSPIIIALMEVVSAEIMSPIILGLSILAQLGMPFLAIYLVAMVFKRKAVQENG